MLKKIKSIFVVDDGSASPSKGVAATSDIDTSSPTVASTSGISESNISAASTETQESSGPNKFLSILAQVIEKNNQPGFDYFEFRQSLINLSKLNMDEATRFKSAYAAAQSMGVSPDSLVNSAQTYLQLLNNEGKKFAQAEQNQRTKVVEDRKNELNQITSEIKSKQDMISRLNQEVGQLNKILDDKKAEASNLATKLESTKTAFENAMKSISGQISEDISKMNQYLK
ncbi:MAG: hypothetical protein ABI761_04560 [Saprospiraceae bacterium]